MQYYSVILCSIYNIVKRCYFKYIYISKHIMVMIYLKKNIYIYSNIFKIICKMLIIINSIYSLDVFYIVFYYIYFNTLHKFYSNYIIFLYIYMNLYNKNVSIFFREIVIDILDLSQKDVKNTNYYLYRNNVSKYIIIINIVRILQYIITEYIVFTKRCLLRYFV